MEGIKLYTNLKDIPSAKYDGYVWMSNEDKPIVLQKEDFNHRESVINPFIVEALLFDEEKQHSIHITHDGSYKITGFDLNTFKKPTFEVVEKSYLPHRLEGLKKVCFKQIWMEEEDKEFPNFPVLTLQATVFCGFKK
jgi:CRISPR type III-associated protein (TIGR04423 family)